MNKDLHRRSLVIASMLAATVASAQSDGTTPSGITLQPSEEGSRHRVGVNYRWAMNLSVDFKRLGGFAAKSNPGMVLGGGMNRTYDNGYNLVDSSGNEGGTTWNWGYDGRAPLNQDQASMVWNWNSDAAGGGVAGDSITLFSSSSPRTARANDERDGPQPGFEVTYEYEVGSLGQGYWGLGGGIGFMNVDIDNDSHLRAPVTQIVDSYALGGVIPPNPPYEGTFEGPGPLLSDSPDRIVTSTERLAHVTGRRRFEADFYGVRLGPYYAWPITPLCAIRADLGVSLNVMKSTTSFRENVLIDTVGIQSSSSRSTDTSFLAGGYAGLGVNLALGDSWDLFAAGQYQYLGQYTDKADGKKAVADFGAMVFVSVGVGYSF